MQLTLDQGVFNLKVKQKKLTYITGTSPVIIKKSDLSANYHNYFMTTKSQMANEKLIVVLKTVMS